MKRLKDWATLKGKGRKGFTLIELIVVMAVLAVLVLLAAPKFLGHTKEAQFTKHINNAKVLEDASERYYIDHGKWPRGLDEDVYTPEEVDAYADKIYDITGEEFALEEGNYWDIDYEALSAYAKLPDESEQANYVLRNPIGKVFYLEGLTGAGLERLAPVAEPLPEPKPNAIVNGTEVAVTTGKTFNFTYTGNVQSVTLPRGSYHLEVWGAKGGYTTGGKGGYSSGVIELTEQDDLYIYVGQKGSSGSTSRVKTFNGGGYGYSNNTSGNPRGDGGGATDIRIRGGVWDSVDGLLSRIIVAGGGGGGYYYSQTGAVNGGDGGGLIGYDGNNNPGSGGKQNAGGATNYEARYNNANSLGKFGKGGDGWPNVEMPLSRAGGGGGWYGGGGGNAAGGGSSYVLTSESHKPAGYAPSVTYHMNNALLRAGNQSMSNPQGGTMVGNSGNGYARITVLEAE